MNKVRVKLLSVTTEAVDLLYSAARQCYHPGWVGDGFENVSLEEKLKLLKAIAKSGHHSVLEHVTFSFAIDGVSRSLTHQLVRHRIASYSQQSQRYAGDSGYEIEEYIIPPSIEKRPVTRERFLKFIEHVQAEYQYFNSFEDIPAEDARYVLPNAAPTRIVVTMNIRSLINFFGERCCMRAQWEIRSLANKMKDICNNELSDLFGGVMLGPKCLSIGFCSEDKSCGLRPKKEKVFEIYDKYDKMCKSSLLQ